MLFIGSPGTGKTMLAQRLPGLLPPMTDLESLESAAILSQSGSGFRAGDWGVRPLRSPHHTVSGAALAGGGSVPRAGEASLAHCGVLFLDELGEFRRDVLETLREPLESGRVSISRAARQAEFPAAFQLIAAMNPCPCGYSGDPSGRCRCQPDDISRYRHRLSGPLLDRIDMHVDVPSVSQTELLSSAAGEASEPVRERVADARVRALARQKVPNASLSAGDTEHHCKVDAAGSALLAAAIERLGLSARALPRLLRLARTIADLSQSKPIAARHVAEAIGCRLLAGVN
jgi:magnesium chelatase family protein